ncbi:MAG: RdgB/HAM1 family non-canonical purine NTP pyrophosphatase [Deltaproteobacteria bacterium]|nr:RdgB/HAM1 family non-canonical purine NTP pyrophosphatase [Deltaproteobacteria bacterium]
MLTFITGNADKLAEVERMLGRSVAHEALALEEIQALDLESVARHKARQAYALLQRPVLVEDTGLALAAWNGLPGALVKWFLVTVGAAGLCRLLQSESNRAATAMTVFAYCDDVQLCVFAGTIDGVIAETPRGNGGFGWDAIFRPHGSEHTFAEMTLEEKDRFSMRRLAVEQLRDSGLLSC